MQSISIKIREGERKKVIKEGISEREERRRRENREGAGGRETEE